MSQTNINRFGTPTGKVGITAVAGVSTMYLRADAGIPLDLTINPTWTGVHTFSGGAAITGGSINGATVGATTAASGAFTTLSSTGTTTLAATTFNSTITANNGIAQFSSIDVNGGTVDGTAIGSTSPNTGAFSTLSATGATTLTTLNITTGTNGLTLTASNAGIEIGSTTTVNTPYIDFHSSGVNQDYDVRLIASGGSSSSTGAATLSIYATTTAFIGNATLNASPAATDNSLQVATTAHVKNVITSMVAGLNLLKNGNFAINQRNYVTNTAMSVGAYGHDRWKSGANGCTYTFTAGVVDTQITITAGSLLQLIETVDASSTVYCLSWTGTATARAWQGSAAGNYSAGTVISINGVNTNYLIISGMTVGTSLAVEFTGGTLGTVQLEPSVPGGLPTHFGRRPYGQELLLCQRYYQTYTGISIGGYSTGSSVKISACVIIPVMMRASPAFALSGQTYTNSSALTVSSASATSAIYSLTGTAAGNASCSFTVIMNAEL